VHCFDSACSGLWYLDVGCASELHRGRAFSMSAPWSLVCLLVHEICSSHVAARELKAGNVEFD